MDEKVRGGGRGGMTIQCGRSGQKRGLGRYWTSPLPNSTWICPPPPIWSRAAALVLTSPLLCSGGQHFIKKRPRDGTGVTRRTNPTPLPLPPSPPLPPLCPALDVPFVWCLMTAVMEPSCSVITPAGSQAPRPSLALHRPRALRLGGMGWVRGSEGQPRRTSQSHFIASDARPGRARGKISSWRSPVCYFIYFFCRKKYACARIMHMLGCARREWAPPPKKYHFHLLRNCLEGSLETCAAGCVSCCLPEHIPSFCSSAY